MEPIEIAILAGLVAIVILLILIGVLIYKLRRIKKQRELKKPIEIEKKIEAEEVEKRKERIPFFKRVRKPREVKEYDVWK